ncbi:MAG: hypothetical protein RM338_32110 [Nostoc sp. DedQUE12a]|nr:hypothetical protein [Nostoc sp. DedQUE12a]
MEHKQSDCLLPELWDVLRDELWRSLFGVLKLAGVIRGKFMPKEFLQFILLMTSTFTLLIVLTVDRQQSTLNPIPF